MNFELESQGRQPEQPELKVIRKSFECTSKMTEVMTDKIPWDSGKAEIAVVAVPENLHEQYRQKFELYGKFERCSSAIKSYLLDNAKKTTEEKAMINIPSSLHFLLQERSNDGWDPDSRLEVFENLRSYVEDKTAGPKFKQKLGNKCGQKVRDVYLWDIETDGKYSFCILIFFAGIDEITPKES